MGKVPLYHSQIKADGVPDLGRQAYMSVSEAARNSTGAALVGAGQAVHRLGGELYEYTVQKKKEKTATELLQQKMADEDAYRTFDKEYRQNNEGISTENAVEMYDTFWENRKTIATERFKDNPSAMRAVDEMHSVMRANALSHAARYSEQQLELHKEQVFTAHREQSAQIWADPSVNLAEKQARLAQEESNIRFRNGQKIALVDGQKQWVGGISPDAEIANLKQNFHQTIVQSNINTGNLAFAREYLNKHAKEFAGAEGQLYSVLESRENIARADAEQRQSREQENAWVQGIANKYEKIMSYTDGLDFKGTAAFAEDAIAKEKDPATQQVMREIWAKEKEYKEEQWHKSLNETSRNFVNENSNTPLFEIYKQLHGQNNMPQEAQDRLLNYYRNSRGQKIKDNSPIYQIFQQIDLGEVRTAEDLQDLVIQGAMNKKEQEELQNYLQNKGEYGKYGADYTMANNAYAQIYGSNKALTKDTFVKVAHYLPSNKPVSMVELKQAFSNLYFDEKAVADEALEQFWNTLGRIPQ